MKHSWIEYATVKLTEVANGFIISTSRDENIYKDTTYVAKDLDEVQQRLCALYAKDSKLREDSPSKSESPPF